MINSLNKNTANNWYNFIKQIQQSMPNDWQFWLAKNTYPHWLNEGTKMSAPFYWGPFWAIVLNGSMSILETCQQATQLVGKSSPITVLSLTVDNGPLKEIGIPEEEYPNITSYWKGNKIKLSKTLPQIPLLNEPILTAI